jgi:hypothetical protein
MNPFIFGISMTNNDPQSIPSASNPFSFGILDMASQLSSSVSMANVNPSFGYGIKTPSFIHLSFGGGHIPQANIIVGGWNLPSSRPNPRFNALEQSAQMGGQFTSYIPSFIPSSSMWILTNTFNMENPSFVLWCSIQRESIS